MNIFKKAKYKKELRNLERELYFKRKRLTYLFKAVDEDSERSTSDDTELNRRENEINFLINRIVQLDKLLYGKESKYY